MYCVECGKQIADNAEACEKCGLPVAHPSGTTVPPQLFAEPSRGGTQVWVILLIVGGLFLGIAQVIGKYYGEKSLSSLSPTELRKELDGTEPIDSDLGLSEQEAMRAMRDTLADLRNESQAEKAAALKPDLALLYSGKSFSTAEEMRRMIDVLNKTLAIDRKRADVMGHWPDTLRAHLDRSHLLSARQKQEVTEMFSEGLFNPEFMKAAHQSLEAESDWIGSTEDLYEFALQHASHVAVTNTGTVRIADARIREQFSEKLSRSQSLRMSSASATQHFNELRSAAMTKVGASSSPLGSEK